MHKIIPPNYTNQKIKIVQLRTIQQYTPIMCRILYQNSQTIKLLHPNLHQNNYYTVKSIANNLFMLN